MAVTKELTKQEKRTERKRRKIERAHARNPKPVIARNDSQRLYLGAMEDCPQVFGIGPAGTGKTYLASRHAARALANGEVAKVYIVRASIAPPRHELGFLPGGLDAKMRPWLVPLMEAMKEEIGATQLERHKNAKDIESVPFSFMRGRTFKDAIVLVDEAQNLNMADFKLLLTRTGENCQIIINGDLRQTDIKDSALDRITDMAFDYDMDAEVIEFTADDVERSAAAAGWVKAFEDMD